MKKILTLFAVVGMMAFSSCSDNNNDVDNDTISEVYQVTGVSFTLQNDYNPVIDLNPSILSADMVLVYRQDGSSGGAPVWKLAPELYYFADGTFNFGYNFNFTVNDVSIYMDGNDLASVSSQNRLNQTFRIVIIPGYLSNTAKSSNKADYSDYNAVIAKYGIDDSKVKEVRVK